MPPQWGGEPQRPECIQARGQRASPHPQESKGTLTSGLLGKVPLGAQVGSPAVAHMSTGGRGLRGGLALHQGPPPNSSLLPPGPPASCGTDLLRVSQLPAAVQGTSLPISSRILSPTAASLAVCPVPWPPDRLPDSLVPASTRAPPAALPPLSTQARECLSLPTVQPAQTPPP